MLASCNQVNYVYHDASVFVFGNMHVSISQSDKSVATLLHRRGGTVGGCATFVCLLQHYVVV